MSVNLLQEAPVESLDWLTFAPQIVEDAEAALGFPFIVLSRFDRAARTTQPVFIGGMHGRNNQRALRLGQRFVPRFDMFTVGSVDANPLLRATFEGSDPVIGSIEDFTRGVVPPLIARIAGRIAGAAHVIAIPLRVEDRVLGSLAYHKRSPEFPATWIRTAQTFSRQVALSIHNAELIKESRRVIIALEASRRLVSEAA